MSSLKPEQGKEKEKSEGHEEDWLLALFSENVNHGKMKSHRTKSRSWRGEEKWEGNEIFLMQDSARVRGTKRQMRQSLQRLGKLGRHSLRTAFY